jgi:Na+/H+-dicarboxylate symporter
MDFRPKLYKIVIGIFLGIIVGFLYYRWHLSYGTDRFLYHFPIGFGTIFILSYIAISLIEKRW